VAKTLRPLRKDATHAERTSVCCPYWRFMKIGIKQLADLRGRIATLKIDDKSQVVSTLPRIEALELAESSRSGRGNCR